MHTYPTASRKEAQLVQALYDCTFEPKRLSDSGFKIILKENCYDEQSSRYILNKVLNTYGDTNCHNYYVRKSLDLKLSILYPQPDLAAKQVALKKKC